MRWLRCLRGAYGGDAVSLSAWAAFAGGCMSPCGSAALRRVSPGLRAAVRVRGAGVVALGGLCGLAAPPAAAGSPGGRVRRGAAPGRRGPADRGAGAGERTRLRPLGRRCHLYLSLADPAAVLAGPRPPARDGPAAAGRRVLTAPGGRGRPRVRGSLRRGRLVAHLYPDQCLVGAPDLVRAVQPGRTLAGPRPAGRRDRRRPARHHVGRAHPYLCDRDGPGPAPAGPRPGRGAPGTAGTTGAIGHRAAALAGPARRT